MLPFNVPKRPNGSSPFHVWCQAVHDQLFKRLIFHNSPTVGIKQNEAGITMLASAAGGNGTTVQCCVITELFGTEEDEAFDYFGATPFNTTSMSTSGAQIIVAKAVTARGPRSEIIPIGNGYGPQTIGYSQYYQDISRFALNQTTGASEYDSIHPRLIIWPGDEEGVPIGASLEQYLVWVTRTTNPTGVLDMNGAPIYYLETNNRVWALDPSLSGS